MTMEPDLCNPACASRALLAVVATKWSLLVLHMLHEGPVRTGDLRRQVGGVSQKMLIQTLRELEGIGLVERESFGEVPPRVEYRLSALGQPLAAKVRELDDWMLANVGAMLEARQKAGAP